MLLADTLHVRALPSEARSVANYALPVPVGIVGVVAIHTCHWMSLRLWI